MIEEIKSVLIEFDIVINDNDIFSKIELLFDKKDHQGIWQILSKNILTPSMPFVLHKQLYHVVYGESGIDPAPCWVPTEEEINSTNLYAIQADLGLKSYWDLHRWSIVNRELFWEKLVDKTGIRFTEKPHKTLDGETSKSPHWFKGGKMNVYESCFQPRGDKPAIVYKEEGSKISYQTFAELNAECNRVANGLLEMGLTKGDSVAIDMLMTVESVAIYLGIIKAGCIAVSIADSLAPKEIQKRLEISNAKLLFTQDVILRASKVLPLYDKVLQANPSKVVVLPAKENLQIRLREQDISWNSFLSDNKEFEMVVCNPMDTINILFSSGTTGEPKAIPWNHTTPIKCAADGYLHHDIQEGNVVSWPTNLGWMMGPWLIFAALINKATIALYHGTPTGLDFVEFVRDAKVNMLGVVPSIVKQWRLGERLEGIDWSCIKNFSSTGESSNAEDMFWMMSKAGYKPVIEYCGGTEIGGGYLTGTMVQPAAPACFTTPALGLDLVMLDDEGARTNKGEVFIIPPSIGLSVSLLNKNHEEEYYLETPEYNDNVKGCSGVALGNQKTLSNTVYLRRHGDEIEDINGSFFRAHGRVDDTMNLGGIKVSSVEIERVANQIEGVKETAAIAISGSGGPSELVIYVVLDEDCIESEKSLQIKMQVAIKSTLNPLFKIKEIQIVATLPRTASNKVMRRTLRKMHLSKIQES